MKLASQKSRDERLPVRAVKGTVFRAEQSDPERQWRGGEGRKKQKRRKSYETGQRAFSGFAVQTGRCCGWLWAPQQGSVAPWLRAVTALRAPAREVLPAAPTWLQRCLCRSPKRQNPVQGQQSWEPSPEFPTPSDPAAAQPSLSPDLSQHCAPSRPSQGCVTSRGTHPTDLHPRGLCSGTAWPGTLSAKHQGRHPAPHLK